MRNMEIRGHIAIVIPSLNPGKDLPGYVASLRKVLDEPIVIVDDGSRDELKPIFDECLSVSSDVAVLRHDVNRGKGRALKTAFAHLLENVPGIVGCVTCDSDGQHAPADVKRAVDALCENPDALVLGCRSFDLSQVPWKSRFGNKWSRALFALASGVSVVDTQTGLRAIPAAFMRELLECPGERFEFETHMLLRLNGRPLVQMPIETLYVNGNSETHFDPFKDSVKIMSIIIRALLLRIVRFGIVSVLSFAIDIGIFSLLFRLVFCSGGHVATLASVCIARAVSLVFNYWANRRFVFNAAGAYAISVRASFARYLGLAAAIMFASFALTDIARVALPDVRVEFAKAVIDLCLWLVSYGAQRAFVFPGTAAKSSGEAV